MYLILIHNRVALVFHAWSDCLVSLQKGDEFFCIIDFAVVFDSLFLSYFDHSITLRQEDLNLKFLRTTLMTLPVQREKTAFQ